MFDAKNAERELERLQRHYAEVSDLVKRFGDRTTILIGGTITSYGLILKVSDQTSGTFGAIALTASAGWIVAAFWFAGVMLLPKESSQPGSTELSMIWNHYVVVSEEAAMANQMDDLCVAIRKKRANLVRSGNTFRLLLACCALALLLVAISEAMSLQG
jgi:hypothetical protein